MSTTTDEVEPDGVVTDEAVSTSTPSTSRPASDNTTPTTGDSNLPRTGAGDVLFIAPFMATVAGYSFSRNRQLQK